MLANQIESYLKRGKMETKDKAVISTGSDILDLVAGGGYEFGTIVNIIGNSASGKTFCACEAIYQAKKKFGDKVRIRYNDAESGFNFNTQELYGFDLQENKVSTPSIQKFMADLALFAKGLKSNEYGFYILDSFDGLASDDDLEELEERMKAEETGKEYKKGSYEMQKAKFSSKLFRTMSQHLKDKNIVLFIISQIRDNVNGGMFEKKWTISGGKALMFYSTTRLFLKAVDKFEVEGRKIGYTANIEPIKSRSKYPNRNCNVSFYFEHGMDRTGSNIDFLYDLRDEKTNKLNDAKANSIAWKEDAEEVTSASLKDFLNGLDKLDEVTVHMKANEVRMTQKNIVTTLKEDFPDLYNQYVDHFGVLNRTDLIEYIEANDLEDEFGKRAVDKWLEIEERIKPKRKKKRL